MNNFGVPKLCEYKRGNELDVIPDIEISLKPANSQHTIKFQAQLYINISKFGKYYGLKFINENKSIKEIIEKFGIEKKQFKRSSPRVPSSLFAQVINGFSARIKPLMLHEDITLDIVNISLSGIGLSTRGSYLDFFAYGEEVICKLEGHSMKNEILCKAKIMNMTLYSVHGGTAQNKSILHLGLMFTSFEKASKDKFLTLIKQTVSSLKK
jgi:hypothetical protein